MLQARVQEFERRRLEYIADEKNIADKEALLATVEAFYAEHNRLPYRGSNRDSQERALEYYYGKLRKFLEESDNGDPQIPMLQARVQQLEQENTGLALLAAIEAFYTEHNRLPALCGNRDKA